MKYVKAQSDVWIQPKKRGWKMRCCDCRLVHDVDFRIVNGKVQLKPRRNNRATAASRRGHSDTNGVLKHD